MIFEDFLRGRGEHSVRDEDRALLEPLVADIRDPLTASTYLIEGYMCRYMDDRQGQRQQLALHVPGDFVDLHGYPLGMLDHDVASLTPCRIATLPHSRLQILIESRPDLMRELWFSTLLDAAMHREWIFRLGRFGAPARIAHFYAETEMRLRAVERSNGRSFALPITQIDLAEACGLTPVHVNRMLRKLRDSHIIDVASRDVKVLDMAALWRIAEFDPAYLFIDDRVASFPPPQ